MANKRINFRDLRKIKGIGLRNFLWELPRKLITSLVVGLTGGQRVLQIGGLLAGLVTAAGAVTTLGVYVLGIAGGVFTALSISVGIYSVVKQSKARAKRIEMIVGKNGSIKDLKKQIALLVKNVSLRHGEMRPNDRESLNKLLFSLHIIEGSTITDKLYDLFDLSGDQNLADEMSNILGDQTNPDVLVEGLRLLNEEYENSLNSVKLKLNNLLQKMAKIKYSQIDHETRLEMRDLIQTLSQLPGDNFYEQVGSLYDQNEADSRNLKKFFEQLPFGIPTENLPSLNEAIQAEKKLMLEEKNAMNEVPLSTFEKAGVFLRAALIGFMGSLSGFGIVVGIASFAGVAVATGGVGLIVLVVACVSALIGIVLFTAASRNAQERKKRFEQEDSAVANLVQNTTTTVKELNTAIHSATPEAALTMTIEEKKSLEDENKRLKLELEALRKQSVESENAPPPAQRAPQGGLFPAPNPKRKSSSPSDPDPAPQDSPPSPMGSQKEQ